MRQLSAKFCDAINTIGVVVIVAVFTPFASAQIAALDKGHQLLVNSGLQIWGCDTGASSFTYGNLTNANFNAVMWSHGESDPGLLSAGQKWGKWVDYTASPATALNSTEQAHYADLVAIQVGDEQQSDIESPGSLTTTWFQNARAGNHFNDRLLYINSFFINSDAAYATFIANANPDAISFDAYPFGTPAGIAPINWLGKAQQFRRHALGSYIGVNGNAARPYGLYLQTYSSTTEGRRDPGDLEMRWQMFSAWTMGYTFVDAFTVGGATSLFNGGSMASPNQPRYNQFKESARQSLNLGPALVRLISYSNGPAGGGTSVVRGRDPSGALNAVPISWKEFNVNDAPPNQRYLTSIGVRSLSHKNGSDPSNPDGSGGFYGYSGDVYVGFFNPLLTTYGDPAGTAYFMITNALGAYLQDPTLLVSDTTQQLTLNFHVGASGINSLQRLSRNTGLVEILPLSHVSGDHYRYIFNLEGGTGDLFKYNDGSPFVGIEQPSEVLYWDNDGVAAGNNIANGAGLGGSGTWDTFASKWFNGATNGTWVANKEAVFWGTAGTITLAAPQSASSLQIKSNGYNITGSTLTVSGSEINVNTGVTATVNSTLAGSAGINKLGAGTLVLGNSSNSYAGGTTISAGVLRVSADGNIGPAPGSFTAGNITLNGGTLQFGGNFDLSNNRGINLGAAGGTIDTQGFTNPTGYTLANGFQGSGNLTKIGSGTFYMNTPNGALNNNWTGNLILKEGTWKITERGGLPYNANQDNVYRPGQVTFDGGTLQITQTISVSSNYRGMTVAAGGGTFDTQNFNFTWGGPLAGSVPTATLTKVGAGTLTFNTATAFGTGPSTYAGKVQVNGGELALNGGGAMGDSAAISLANTAGVFMSISSGWSETVGSLEGGGPNGGNVTVGVLGNLTTGGNNSSTTFDGVISGSGSLTKTGTGTMTLTRANTYGGTTTINGGALRVNNSSGSGGGTGNVVVNTGGTLGGSGTIGASSDTSNVTVNSGGHIAPGNSAGTLNLFGVTTLNSGSVLDYDLANVTTAGSGINDLLAVDGQLTLGGPLTLNIDAYQGTLANGTYKLITYTQTLSGDTSGWTVTSNAPGVNSYTFSTAMHGEVQLIVAPATPTWTGAISASWDTGGNWQMNVEPNSAMDVVFPTPIPATGATITLTNGEAARTVTFNDNYVLSGGDLNVAAGTVSVASGKTATISSVLAGSAGITKTGAGTLFLAGANTYSGGTNINAGTLRVAADTNLGNGSGGVTFGGGTLLTTSSFSSARAIAINSGGGTISVGGSTTSLTGTIAGAAANTLTKIGSGSLILAQSTPRSGLASSWLGNITVNSGTLKVGNGGSTGFLPGYDPIAYAGLPPTVPTISLADGTTLEFNHAAGGATQDTAHAVVISGFGGVVISGAKTEVFVANNTYTGSTIINSGSSLRIGWGGVLNTGGLGATWIHNSGALTFSNDHNTTFPGLISGSGTLLKEYNGTLTLTGTATHTGGTTIATGSLQVGGGGATGSISGNITNNAKLAFNRSDNVTYGGIVSGAGSVEQRGAGTLVLSGANTYSGGTAVAGGTLAVNGSIAGNAIVQNGATLAGSGAIGGTASVQTGGTLSPGNSAETINVGGLTLANGSFLHMEVGLLSDQVIAGGSAALGGTLALSLLEGFTPNLGQSFTLLTANAMNGTFNSESLPLFSNRTFDVIYNSQSVIVQVVPQLPGDFNVDGTVDAADYVVWRKTLAATFPDGYETWRAHFGETLNGGNGSSTVPESAAWMTMGIGLVAAAAFSPRLRRGFGHR